MGQHKAPILQLEAYLAGAPSEDETLFRLDLVNVDGELGPQTWIEKLQRLAFSDAALDPIGLPLVC